MFKLFVSYYKNHLKLFVLDISCVFLMGVVDLIFPLATRYILKGELHETTMILLIGFILLLLYLLRYLFSFIIGYYGHLLGILIETDMRKDLFNKFETMDYQYYDDKKTGELLANLTTHLHDVSEMSHHGPEDIFISIFMIIGSFIVLAFINIYLTLIVFVAIAILVFVAIIRRKKLMASFRLVKQEQGELSAKIASSLSGIHLTKAFNNEKYEINKFADINTDYKKARQKSFKELGLFNSSINFLTNMTNLILLISGSLMVAKNLLDLEDLVAFFLYINFLISPITKLANSMETIQQGWAGFERFAKIMEIKPKIVSKENAIHINKLKGQIEFKDVSFQYKNENEEILAHFDLKIPAGKKVALVGETGVGKSTIAKIIPRFYDVNHGEVLIDNINVKDYDLYDLRREIGHVQQDVIIFWGSIKDNILYGNPNASEQEIIIAAKKANIYDYIMSLPDGFDTMVGERGIQLSGGQKQRLSIARLFLKNPSIIILDEATSSLDNVTEKQIQQAFDKLSLNKTTLVIAHRLTTIKNADLIVVLGKNGILEEGTHQSLMDKQGIYYKMYTASQQA